MGLRHVLVAFGTALLVVLVAWLARSGHWRRGRLALAAGAAVILLGILGRRLGLGELAVLAILVLIPFVLVPARRSRAPADDR